MRCEITLNFCNGGDNDRRYIPSLSGGRRFRFMLQAMLDHVPVSPLVPAKEKAASFPGRLWDERRKAAD